jgi:hypothetical protein
VQIASDIQAIFFRRRHRPRRPPLAKIRPGSAEDALPQRYFAKSVMAITDSG